MTPLASPVDVAGAPAPATTQRVAYVVSSYPAVSHTFISREICGLRAAGVAVDVFSIHAATPSELLTPDDVAEAAATTTIFPLRPIAFARAHLHALRCAPNAYFATLRRAIRHGPRGARARLWQVFYFAEAVFVWSRCQARGVHHLHAHLANVAADVAWWAAAFGAAVEPDADWRWTFTMHGCIEFWDVQRFNLTRKVANAELVLCISDFTRAQLMALCEPEHWHKLRVVHCGVDLARYRPAVDDTGKAKKQAGSPVDILVVGRLSSEKGHLVMLEAFAELRRRTRNVHLTVVGDGPLRAELEASAHALGLDGTVTFTGAVGQDEMPTHFQHADIFCQPSFAEGIPVVLMEAMACGLPVVSSRVAGVPELVGDDAGVLVPPGRADALADALYRLVAAPTRRAAMGRAGRTAVERGFDADANARDVAAAFAEMSAP